MQKRRVGVDGRYEYVVDVEPVSFRADQPLYAASLVAVIDQGTGVELAARLDVPDAFGETPDDAVARLAGLADQALTDL